MCECVCVDTFFLLKNKDEAYIAKSAEIFMVHNFAVGRAPKFLELLGRFLNMHIKELEKTKAVLTAKK